jgi:group I intron endonuclease
MRTNYYLKKTTGIYCFTHIESGRQYVGQSVDCFERWKQHSTPKKNSKGIKGAIMEFGICAFQFRILETCSREQLNERERYWIAELGTISPSGYNLNSGSK